MIRETTKTDSEALSAIVKDSGQFDENGFAHIYEPLNNHLTGESNDL
jgi:hypothetical protein